MATLPFALAAVLALTGQAPGAAAETAPAGVAGPLPSNVSIPRCIVTLINEVQLPARVPGQIVELNVVEGASVARGQQIGKLDDNDVRLKRAVTEVERDISDMQSRNDVKVKAAKAAEDLSQAELEQGLALARRNSIAPSEVRRLEFALDKSRYEHQAAMVEQTIQQRVVVARDAQLAAADDEIQRRQLISPINGVVERRLKHIGEWVNPGDVVLNLVQLDLVRVEGFMNSRQVAPHEVIGRPVTIEVQLARGQVERFKAHIGYTSSKDDAAGEYRVWAILENRQAAGQWIVRAGQHASMIVHVDQPRVEVPRQ